MTTREQREAMLRDLEWPRSRIDDIIRHVRTLLADIDEREQQYDTILAFMNGVRDTARNRNPDGATLLDFMAVWNEQLERQYAELKAAVWDVPGEPPANYDDVTHALTVSQAVDQAKAFEDVEELWEKNERLRRGDEPCVDDDGTPFASARVWRAANAEAMTENNAIRSELAVLSDENERLRQLLAAKDAALGVFADKGNWDMDHGESMWVKFEMMEAGVPVLVNPHAFAQRERDRAATDAESYSELDRNVTQPLQKCGSCGHIRAKGSRGYTRCSCGGRYSDYCERDRTELAAAVVKVCVKQSGSPNEPQG